VLCSDLHIRADSPICRTDDFQRAMFIKLVCIFDMCRSYDIPFLCGGDIGHRSQWPNWLLERFMALAGGVTIISALGQHDLPGHNLGELERSACGVLQRAGVVSFNSHEMHGHQVRISHFGEGRLQRGGEHVLITHRMVIDIKEDYPDQQADDAVALMKLVPNVRLILTGDNHKPFVVKYGDQLLVNPGSMMRMTAAQANHKPRVYLWDAQKNVVKPVYLPIEEGVVDRTHIDSDAARDERMRSFTERVKMDYDDGVDFVDELNHYLKTNRTWDKTKGKIMAACERGDNA
jgi:predicted phosphodiesterase